MVCVCVRGYTYISKHLQQPHRDGSAGDSTYYTTRQNDCDNI